MLERIRAEIAESGPMPFDRFMELALYDPDGGYYTTGALRSGRSGDFLTSPEVSPLFGSTIARFVATERERLGEPFTVVECGAGGGSLLRPLLEALPGVAARAVEVSPAARERLAAIPEVEVVDRLDRVPGGLRGVVIANELLDNLPAAVAIRRDTAWMEEMVTLGEGGLVPVEVPARPEVADWADRHAGRVPEGARVEVQLAAGAWVEQALSLLEAGTVVAIDYGDDAAGLLSRRTEGTVRTYRGHHLGPDPLLDPGSADITVDVDFGALADRARGCGADVEVITQREFLERWGLVEVAADLRRDELEAARSGDAMERLRLRSRLTEAETLLHPRGLGDFRVLVARVQVDGEGVP